MQPRGEGAPINRALATGSGLQLEGAAGCDRVSPASVKGLHPGRWCPRDKSCSSRFPLQPKELDPTAVLPLDCLLAFVFFDANWCGYLHRRDLERILLTLGLRLSAEQVLGS